MPNTPALAKIKKPTATDTSASLTPELEKLIGGRVARRAVVDSVLEQKGAFSAQDLYLAMRSSHPVGKATIYRTLRLLLERNILRESVLRDGTRVYQQANDPRTILWVCDDCSAVFALSAESELQALYELGRRSGLHPGTVTVEVHSTSTKTSPSGRQCDHG